ncbi:MAG: acetyl-CoA carboxylase biotin carboxylase subunit [Motiliproteus sp.]
MFTKILIANRGEIACRIITSAQRLGIRCVAVYSEADRQARHVAMADESFYLGGAAAQDSYLNAELILELAKKCGAEAIHPGYGFLSENPHFADSCAKQQIEFIGPSAAAIRSMGSKSAAKTIMEKAGIPMLPGYHGAGQSLARIKAEAQHCGYPLLLKAVAGGGGKGMRTVNNESEFDHAYAAAKREAASSFNNDDLLVEKYLQNPRHVEIQIFADKTGNTIYLADRDCSVQRRYQKVVEEAPAPNIPDDVRKAMGETAVKAAQAINYVGAGTIEFLYDDSHHKFYFMEMNTRLQVEHPVTEMVTGQDLVAWQLKVANGETLPLTQQQVQISGHAIEVRVYAEDPASDFLPATGTLHYLRTPEESRHLRIDTGVIEGDEVSIYYDPMIAKLICWDETRSAAIAQMRTALQSYRIAGLNTNLDFLKNLIATPAFASFEVDTGFIERHKATLLQEPDQDFEPMLVFAACFLTLQRKQQYCSHGDPTSPFNHLDNWRLNAEHTQPYALTHKHIDYQLEVKEQGPEFQISLNQHQYQVRGELNGERLSVAINGHQNDIDIDQQGSLLTLFKHGYSFACQLPTKDFDQQQQTNDNSLLAPMNGTVVAILQAVDDEVDTGDGLIVIEAMKMEHCIKAPYAGVITEYYYQPGDLVDEGSILVALQATDASH